ncbi:MAG: hypothetical protein AAFX09_06100 [Pseudomonadota bacterium]
MIEPVAVSGPAGDPIEQIAFVEELGRVVSFRLEPGRAVPETRSTQLLLVALADLTLDVGAPLGETTRIQLEAGQVRVFPQGVAGLTNAGADDARFTIIDLAAAQ